MELQNSGQVLLEAVKALYHHPDAEIRSNANKWLDDFQHTVEAWQVADNLLHDPNSDFDILYFCAQTLRTKVQRDFEDLPPSALLSLRSSLMTLLIKFRHGPPAVRTQLCLGMVALAVHLPPDQWGKGVVQWLGTELGAQDDVLPCLLELVTVLPQESPSYSIGARPETRRQFQRALVASVDDAFTLLTSCLNHESLQRREQVLGAFSSWLRLSHGVPSPTLATHPLVTASLAGLNSPETFDAAVDVTLELIHITVSGKPADLAAHMSLVQVIVPAIMGLRSRFSAAVTAARAEKAALQVIEQSFENETNTIETEQEDDDITKGMACLFAEMGEYYVDLIATGSAESLMIVDAIAEVTSHPDDNIAAMTFYFWYKLKKALTSRDGLEQMLNLGGGAALDAEREKRLAIFRPKYELLVSLISFRVTYPQGFELWRKDELSDFKQTRYGVADLLPDAAAVLGGEVTLRLLAQPFLQMAASHQNGAQWEWRSLEASLYCIRAIAKDVPNTENVILPQVINLLPQLPQEHKLLYTASLMIGALADWLSSAPGASFLLPNILGLVINCLSVSDDACAAAAALALKHICDACRSELGKSVDALLGVYQEALSGTGKYHLSPDDELELIEGLSMVVSSLPADRVQQALEALCIPVLVPLAQLVSDAQRVGTGQTFSSKQYIKYVDRIANIFRYVNQPQLLAGVFQQMWPLLQAIFVQRADDIKTMERLCRACKYAVRKCGKALGNMIAILHQELQDRFLENPHSCLLYLASELIKSFGSDPDCMSYLGTLISVLFGKTISLLQTIRDFTARPDLTDDCFLLASRCMRYCPGLLVPSPIMPALFQCAMAGITIQHREACRSILTFLQELLELPLSHSGKQYRPFVDSLILSNGPTLTRVIIGALVGALPESRMEELIEVMLSLSRLYGQLVVQWAHDTASLIPTTVVTEAEKASFLHAVAVAAAGENSPELTKSIEEMSDVCRRNRKTRDIVQLALQPQITISSAS